MKKGIIFAICLLIGCYILSAQQPDASISFKDDKHDFGKINEVDGLVSYVFEFTNTGKAPLVLQSVQPTCGCTTPEWSKEPVKPGAKGYIKATFNPSGRPGSFDKSINITTNFGSATVKFSGIVIPPTAKLDDEYRYAIGDLRFKTNHVGFGSLNLGRIKKMSFEFINTGTVAVSIGLDKLPAFLNASVSAKTIKPKQKGTIEVAYDAAKKNDWGFLLDYFFITLNGKQDSKNKLTVSATISDDFSTMSADEKAKGPKLKFENTSYQFVTTKVGNKIAFEYKFKNDGKSNLLIRKIVTTCGCITAAASTLVVKPQTTGSIKGIFDTTDKKGTQNYGITVVSNDPHNSQTVLWLKGIVE